MGLCAWDHSSLHVLHKEPRKKWHTHTHANTHANWTWEGFSVNLFSRFCKFFTRLSDLRRGQAHTGIHRIPKSSTHTHTQTQTHTHTRTHTHTHTHTHMHTHAQTLWHNIVGCTGLTASSGGLMARSNGAPSTCPSALERLYRQQLVRALAVCYVCIQYYLWNVSSIL